MSHQLLATLILIGGFMAFLVACKVIAHATAAAKLDVFFEENPVGQYLMGFLVAALTSFTVAYPIYIFLVYPLLTTLK